MVPVSLGTLPNGAFPAGTLMSEALVRQHDAHVDDMHVQLFPSPSNPSTPSFHSNSLLAIPHRRALGCPPGVILGFSMESALSLSRASSTARYSVTNVSSLGYESHGPRRLLISYPWSCIPRLILPGNVADMHPSRSDTRLRCVPFYGLPPSTHTSTSIPLFQDGKHKRGDCLHAILAGYIFRVGHINHLDGDLMLQITNLCRLRSSKDGT
ncbi:uncharacterized protein EI90DRAFT_1111074 [Cantharellus anzutake]|uniref:uncharacterized protein n=1 Tax=Cantharellus anzutake TaxID=1750568 RepID=UPI00190465DD|nr:uncharacterized protein EI90DRAFT_1111074 [Cantharellus anzutake]KAF8330912.1 hypothetical protein EI90DRAFT_1111074 [Cantharellus anzutake]